MKSKEGQSNQQNLFNDENVVSITERIESAKQQVSNIVSQPDIFTSQIRTPANNFDPTKLKSLLKELEDIKKILEK
jgi:hypothetical protein